MKTDNRSQVLGVLALTSCVLFFGSCTERPAEITWSDPGFTEAYFDRKQLDELSDDSKMEYFHFYNVLPERDAEVGSVMAMGAYGDHKEVYSYIGGPWYRMYESLSGTRTICDRLTSDGAEEKVSHLRRAGLTPYAAVFTRKEVMNAFDALSECNAIRLTPVRTEDDRYWTMRITPVRIEDGVARVVGGTEDERMSTNPCPTYCGLTPSYFVHCR